MTDNNKHKKQNFKPDTWTQLQYHNERIYYNFEFFIKITLAISGGLSYLIINKITENAELVSYIVKLGAMFEILSGIIASTAIFFHVKSKIKRFEVMPKSIFKEMWTWLEPYFIIFILFTSFTIAWVAWFKISIII